MKRASIQTRQNRNNSFFETLEGRQMMSASPFVINGTPGNDIITVNYGVNLVVGQTGTTTTKPVGTVTKPIATTTVATTRSTAIAKAVVAAPISSMLNRLTYTINGVTNSTTLQAGQIVVVNGLDGNDIITVTGNVNTQLNGGNGNDVIMGGSGNDTIHGGAGDDIEHGGAGNDVIYADSGFDFEYGDAGNDQLFGGTGVNYLYGGDGDDTMVSIGGSTIDRQWGGAGNNSFWLDKPSTECVMDATSFEAAHNVHRVGGYDALDVNGKYVETPSLAMNVGNLPDPASGGYATQNFANVPLFSNTPIANDVNQGNVGDCYFLATLSAVAKNDPNVIRQSVVSLGDGTYCVDFKRNGADHFIRVDADLPVYSNGAIVNDHFGSTTTLWAPIMEKAFAFFRTGAGTYASTNSGFPSEAFNDLGISNSSYMPHNEGFLDLQSEGAQDFGNHMASLLANGDSVILCTPGDSAYLEDSHCYMLDHVNYTNGIVTSIVVRNPWGHDGRGGDGVNDGYVTMTDLDMLKSVDLVSYAKA